MKFVIAFLTAILILKFVQIPDEGLDITYFHQSIGKNMPNKAHVGTETYDTKVYPSKPYIPKSEIERLICEYFRDDCAVAVAVARAESGLRPDAVGDGAIAYIQDGVEYGKSYGVFQVRHLPGRPDPASLLDPKFNIEYAYNLYQRSGFNPWSAFTNSSYLRFL